MTDAEIFTLLTTLGVWLLGGLAYSRISKENRKLRAALAESTAKNKQADSPKPPPPPPPKNPLECIKVNPSGGLVLRDDIDDIFSLFNYLMSRTGSKTASAADAVAEVNDFIVDNMIDLRDQKGLICTDGHYLLQYGRDASSDPFILVEMKTPAMIQKFKYKLDKDLFIPFWDREARKFLLGIGADEARKLLLDGFEYTRNSDVISGDYAGQSYVPAINRPSYEVSDDPLLNVRTQVGYQFSSSMTHILDSTVKRAKEELGNKKTIVAFDDCMNVYLVLYDFDCRQYFIITPEKARAATANRIAIPTAKYITKLIDYAENNTKEIFDPKKYKMRSDIFGLTFVTIDLKPSKYYDRA